MEFTSGASTDTFISHCPMGLCHWQSCCSLSPQIGDTEGEEGSGPSSTWAWPCVCRLSAHNRTVVCCCHFPASSSLLPGSHAVPLCLCMYLSIAYQERAGERTMAPSAVDTCGPVAERGRLPGTAAALTHIGCTPTRIAGGNAGVGMQDLRIHNDVAHCGTTRVT